MKQGGLIIAGLVLMFTMVVLPVMAEEQPHVNYETYMVDNFDSPGTDWTWQAAASKFVTQGYPVIKYFDGQPNAIRITQADPNAKYKFMGLEVKFDRQGDNWVDIYPQKKDANGKDGPYEIPFKGRISRLDLWVWGAHYAYELEILVRDCNGRVHTLSFGPVNHEGWEKHVGQCSDQHSAGFALPERRSADVARGVPAQNTTDRARRQLLYFL